MTGGETPRTHPCPRWIPAALAAVTVLLFLPTLRNGFVWDDHLNLTTVTEYRGLAWENLRWMLTTVHRVHYIPLTRLTFGLDYVLWGMDPAGYHLTNVLLHGANAALFFLVARRLLGLASPLAGRARLLGAAVAALFFALHPLRVESVAWVTERRDVLAGSFFLVTVLLYLKAQTGESGSRRRLLGLSLVTYVLALASKSIVMTLPGILLLLDVYPLGRLRGGPRTWLTAPGRGVWLEKVPYGLLSLAAAAIALYANQRVATLGTYSWPTRLTVALYGAWFYVVKTWVPTGLSPLYEVPIPLDPSEPRFLAGAAGTLALSAALVAVRRQWPAGLAVWVYQLVVLAPVSGLPVRAGFQLAADRYSYLACLGWALLVGAGAGAIGAHREGARRPWRQRVARGVIWAWLLTLAVLTWRQIPVWRDSETLWAHAVWTTPECAICRHNYAMTLQERNEWLAALGQLQQAQRLRPDREAHEVALGQAFERLGMLGEARARYESARERHPESADVRRRLGELLVRVGEPTAGVAQLRRAHELAPGDLAVRVSLGLALPATGQAREAVHVLRGAVELSPQSAWARLGLVQAHLALGERDLARDAYLVLRRLAPDLASRFAATFPGD